jgi:hypothetical protein
MKCPERRLKNASDIAAEVPELIVNRQSNAGTIRRLLKDQKIAGHSCAVSDRTANLIVTNPKQRVYDPAVNPDLPQELRHRVQIVPPRRQQHRFDNQPRPRSQHLNRSLDASHR